MRILMLLTAVAIAAGSASLSGCTSDPNAPGLQAMEAPNSCGPAGTKDREACSNR